MEYGTGGTSTKEKITERTVAAAAPLTRDGVPSKRLILDTELRGFGLVVNATGSKSYVVMRRVNGRPVRFKFKNVGEVTVAEARKQAASLLGKMSDGVDLIAQRRRARQEAQRAQAGITLDGAIALTEAAMNARGRAPRTVDDMKDRLRLYLAGWLERPLASITRQEVRERHAALATEIASGRYVLKRKNGRGRRRVTGDGTRTANRTFQLFRNVWNRAAREHEALGEAPIHSVNWFKEPRYEPALKPEALREWHEAVSKLENAVRRDFLLFALFSGMRRTTIAEMRWEHVDLTRRVLRVPNPKGGAERAFDLPLSSELVEILARRLAEHEKLVAGKDKMRPWVFPSQSATGHLSEPREDGVPGTVHDLRRMFITVATHRLKLHVYDVKLLVNHVLRGDVTMGYVAPDVEQLRAPMQAIADALKRLCEPAGPTKAKVVQMRRERRAAAAQA